MVTYKASGIVLGNCWGGGIGSYVAREIKAVNRASLVQQIENGIKDGSLDGGVGFESLIGALMVIDEIDSRKIDGKMFIAHDCEDEFFGDITPAQEEMLINMQYSS